MLVCCVLVCLCVGGLVCLCVGGLVCWCVVCWCVCVLVGWCVCVLVGWYVGVLCAGVLVCRGTEWAASQPGRFNLGKEPPVAHSIRG